MPRLRFGGTRPCRKSPDRRRANVRNLASWAGNAVPRRSLNAETKFSDGAQPLKHVTSYQDPGLQYKSTLADTGFFLPNLQTPINPDAGGKVVFDGMAPPARQPASTGGRQTTFNNNRASIPRNPFRRRRAKHLDDNRLHSESNAPGRTAFSVPGHAVSRTWAERKLLDLRRL